jgi:nucleoside-diphosphate-sugar epimerase
MPGARVLVTGGEGFLGRQIVAALRALGATVLAPAHRTADLLTEAGRAVIAAGGAEILVHGAWVTDDGAFWQSPQNLEWVAASVDLARRFRAAGGERIVFIGSCAEYTWSPSDAAWTESRACRPFTPYGAAKLLTWTALRDLARRTGLVALNARVFSPVGPHERPHRLLPSLIRAVLHEEPLAVGPASETRDLVDVRDAGEAVARLALARVGGVVNVGSGRPVRLDELVAAVAGAAAPLVRLGGRQLPRGEPIRMVADIGRLRRVTGFGPRIPLAETIADSFAHWQAALALAA